MSISWALSREARTAAGLSLLLAAGCVENNAPPATAPVSTPGVELPAVSVPEPEPAAAEALEPRAAPSAPTPAQQVRAPAPGAEQQPAASKVASNTAASSQASTATTKPASAPSPALVPAPTPAPTTAPKAAPAPVAARPATPPLDLKSLETRLRDTKAVGVFTKLSLKNQVDDLLNQFRAYHKSQTPTLAALRQSYNLLMLKVLALLQDSDPTLARDIVASREAIWGVLSDPQKFTESNLMAGVLP
ncbi:MAG: hypothetical protein MUO39_07075 [Steroidobacteraceae bacterium]|nr:hypothetical protein [Steroidobacteraceae bacterium]